MFVFSNKTNLLERAETSFPLQDIDEPNLFRTIFDYDEVPRIAFNHRTVPINMPAEIWITDTTFRDGQQSIPPYTVKQIVDLFSMLHRLGGPNGIIRQSEFFVYSKRDQEAVYKCLEMGYEFPEVTGWIRASEKDFDLVKDMGLKETGILVSCSDYHIFHKMKMTRRQALNHYLGIVRKCIEKGIRPRCHFEDITRADMYGFVVPFAVELMNLMNETGVPIKIRACDTMGYGITYPGSVLPRCVQGIIHGLVHHSYVPSELIEWHGHNDFYRSVTNAAHAWLYGACAVNCSLLGIGERTGNTPLEAMVIEYAQLRGTFDGMDPTVITEIAEYYEKEVGYKIHNMTPFVGRDFNVTRAGIHADGLLKNEEIYNVFNTDKFLNRSPRVAISNTSGVAGIAHFMNMYLGLKGDDAYKKNHPVIEEMKRLVDVEYENGRVTLMADEEIIAMYEKVKETLQNGQN